MHISSSWVKRLDKEEGRHGGSYSPPPQMISNKNSLFHSQTIALLLFIFLSSCLSFILFNIIGRRESFESKSLFHYYCQHNDPASVLNLGRIEDEHESILKNSCSTSWHYQFTQSYLLLCCSNVPSKCILKGRKLKQLHASQEERIYMEVEDKSCECISTHACMKSIR